MDNLTDYEAVALDEFIGENWSKFLTHLEKNMGDKDPEHTAQTISAKLIKGK